MSRRAPERRSRELNDALEKGVEHVRDAAAKELGITYLGLRCVPFYKGEPGAWSIESSPPKLSVPDDRQWALKFEVAFRPSGDEYGWIFNLMPQDPGRIGGEYYVAYHLHPWVEEGAAKPHIHVHQGGTVGARAHYVLPGGLEFRAAFGLFLETFHYPSNADRWGLLA